MGRKAPGPVSSIQNVRWLLISNLSGGGAESFFLFCRCGSAHIEGPPFSLPTENKG
jgi:hypothetical protein